MVHRPCGHQAIAHVGELSALARPCAIVTAGAVSYAVRMHLHDAWYIPMQLPERQFHMARASEAVAADDAHACCFLLARGQAYEELGGNVADVASGGLSEAVPT